MTLEGIVEKYDGRFEKKDRRRFRKKGITPQIANSYPKRFNGHDIDPLVENNIPPKVAEKYERYGGWGVSAFVRKKIPPELVNKYHGFDHFDVSVLIEKNITPEQANPYAKRFWRREIEEMIKAGIGPEIATRYDARFDGRGVLELIDSKVPPEKANLYHERFNGMEICHLVEAGCSPETAEKYPKKFPGTSIAEFLKKQISPETASYYAGRFWCYEIIALFKANISNESAKAYPNRFSGEDIVKLVEARIKPGRARRYSKRFKAADIALLSENNIPPEKANKYDKKFDTDAIRTFARDKISPSTAKAYGNSFSPSHIIQLFKKGIKPRNLKSLSGRFEPDKLVELVKSDVPIELALQYDKRFSAYRIIELRKVNCSPKEANLYDERFSFYADTMWKDGCAPKVANAYDDSLHPLRVLRLFEMGLSSKTPIKLQQMVSGFIGRAGQLLSYRLDIQKNFLRESQSGVYLINAKEKGGWKISEDIKEEYKILDKIRKMKNTKNLVRIKNKIVGGIAVEIENLGAKSLEEKVKESGKLPAEKIILYGLQILNGLTEMRRAGVWHNRNLSPENIRLDDDLVLLTDFGNATDDRHADSSGRQEFGGKNDLVSLGKIMYYMAIGKREELKLEEIVDAKLKNIIKECLEAEHYHTRKLQRLFSPNEKERFTPAECRELEREGIEIGWAEKYNFSYTAKDIIVCAKNGIYPGLSRIEPLHSRTLIRSRVPLNYMIRYDGRFTAEDIVLLYNKGVPFETANSAPIEMSAQQIVGSREKIIRSEISEYDKRFSVDDIRMFRSLNAHRTDIRSIILSATEAKLFMPLSGSPDIVNRYPEKFGRKAIHSLLDAGLGPDLAEYLHRRFSIKEMIDLYHRGCQHPNLRFDMLADYRPEFDVDTIIEFLRENVTPDMANRYSPRFKTDIIHMCRESIDPILINKFSKRFDASDARFLLHKKVAPELANQFDKRFEAFKIADFVEINCAPSQANSYAKRFDGYAVLSLVKEGVSPETANKYDRRFESYQIEKLIKLMKTPEDANSYPKKLTGSNVLDLIQLGCVSEIVSKYNERFSSDEILRMVNYKCPPETANKYIKDLSGLGIAVLYKIGIRPENTSSDAQKKRVELLGSIIKTLRRPESYSLIGTGSSSIVVAYAGEKVKYAWKFSKNIDYEYSMLDKIRKRHKDPKNIIRTVGKVKQGMAVRLRHAGNMTLDELIKSQKLDDRTIVRLGYHMMNGLIEMRQAGIWYHRDLRPANIVVKDYLKGLVIVDFGIATTDRRAHPKNNRRFGGPNDLVSLGQIMYYMATQKHIFSESQSMSLTLDAENINDYRNEVYSDATGTLLRKHLEQVDMEINGPIVKNLVKECLTAKNYHYKRMYRLFKEAKEKEESANS